MARLFALLVVSLASLNYSFAQDFGSPFVGVEVVAVADASNPFKEERIRFPSKIGVYVVRVAPKSPAEKAGLKVGDIITSVDKKKTHNVAQFLEVISKLEPGMDAVFSGYGKHDTGWAPGNVKVLTASYGEYLESSATKAEDEFTGTVTYRSPYNDYSPRQTHLNTAVSKAEGNSGYQYRARLLYADNPSFLASAIFKTDGEKITIKSLGSPAFPGAGAHVYTLEPSKEQESLILAISQAKQVAYRLIATDGVYEEFEMSQDEIRDIKHIVDLKRWLEKK